MRLVTVSGVRDTVTASPSTIAIVPRVAMNEGTWSRNVIAAFEKPTAAPISSAARTATGIGLPAASRDGTTTEIRPTTAPTERSNSPTMITKVAPMEMTISKAACCQTSNRVWTLQNAGMRSPNAAVIAITAAARAALRRHADGELPPKSRENHGQAQAISLAIG